MLPPFVVSFARFLFNDTATTEMYTLSLHDALPITPARRGLSDRGLLRHPEQPARSGTAVGYGPSRERRTGRHPKEVQLLHRPLPARRHQSRPDLAHQRGEGLEGDEGDTRG